MPLAPGFSLSSTRGKSLPSEQRVDLASRRALIASCGAHPNDTRMNRRDRDEFALAALLHDIGFLVLNAAQPEEYPPSSAEPGTITTCSKANASPRSPITGRQKHPIPHIDRFLTPGSVASSCNPHKHQCILPKHMLGSSRMLVRQELPWLSKTS